MVLCSLLCKPPTREPATNDRAALLPSTTPLHAYASFDSREDACQRLDVLHPVNQSVGCQLSWEGRTCFVDAGEESLPRRQHVHGRLDRHTNHVAVCTRQRGIVRLCCRNPQRFLPVLGQVLQQLGDEGDA